MKISLSQCQIGIRQRGLHSFGPCNDNGQEGKEWGGGGRGGGAHLDPVIMTGGVIQTL